MLINKHFRTLYTYSQARSRGLAIIKFVLRRLINISKAYPHFLLHFSNMKRMR